MQRFKVAIAFVAICLSAASNRLVRPSPAAPHTPVHVKPSLVNNYGDSPLAFEANLGQADDSAKFLSRGAGYALWLTQSEAVLQLHRATAPRGKQQPPTPPDVRGERTAGAQTTIRMRMIGANPAATPSGLAPLPTRINYFIGNDPARWRSNVPTFSRVRYENEYPGIDLVFYGQQRALEYDWVARPGSDPHAIELAFDGADQLTLDANGDLLVHTADGGDVVRQHRPLVYQLVDGRQEPIDAGYVIERDGHVKLWTAEYDRRISLVIDPVLDYATYLGGRSDDWASAIAVDADGNAYVAGQTSSAGFPLKNPIQPTIGSDHAAFVAKLNRDGSGLVYATYLGGGSGSQGVYAIALDAAGHAYVTGSTTASNFPVTPGAFQVAFGGGPCSSGSYTYSCSDAFVVKLSASGSALEYASYLGGSKEDYGRGIAVDTAGNAYVTGDTASPDFPFTPGAFQQGRGRSKNFFGVFVAKINADGRALGYVAYLDDAEATGIAVDASRYAYVTGNATENHPTTPGAFQTDSGYTFVSKLTPDGAALAYSTRLGGTSTPHLGFSFDELEGAYAIAVDAHGNAYVTGFTDFTDFPTTAGALFSKAPCNGANISGAAFWDDGFVTKLSADGRALEYSTYLGGCLGQVGRAIAVDTSGNAYVAGNTNSADFPVTSDALQGTLAPGTCSDRYACFDAFLIKLNPSGTEALYSTYLGGPGQDGANGVAVDSTGHAYIAGSAGIDFPTTRGVYQPLFGGVDKSSFAWPLFNGGGDAFVARLSLGLTSPDHALRAGTPRASTSGGVSPPASPTAWSVRMPGASGSRMRHRLKMTDR
jgi:hypothetical protein